MGLLRATLMKLRMYGHLRQRRRCEDTELATVLLVMLLRMSVLLLLMMGVKPRRDATWAMREMIIHAAHAHVHMDSVLAHAGDLASRLSMMREGLLFLLLDPGRRRGGRHDTLLQPQSLDSRDGALRLADLQSKASCECASTRWNPCQSPWM